MSLIISDNNNNQHVFNTLEKPAQRFTRNYIKTLKITRQVAEDRLKNEQIGSYLIRNSSQPNFYAVSYKLDHGVQHLLLRKHQDGTCSYKLENSTSNQITKYATVEKLLFIGIQAGLFSKFEFNNIGIPLEDVPAIPLQSKIADILYEFQTQTQDKQDGQWTAIKHPHQENTVLICVKVNSEKTDGTSFKITFLDMDRSEYVEMVNLNDESMISKMISTKLKEAGKQLPENAIKKLEI